jgi:hypothetical protein
LVERDACLRILWHPFATFDICDQFEFLFEDKDGTEKTLRFVDELALLSRISNLDRFAAAIFKSNRFVEGAFSLRRKKTKALNRIY